MIEASYFDGRTSRRHAVRLRAVPGGLEVVGAEAVRTEPAAGIRISEPVGTSPRTLTFADGACCEVAQGPALNSLLTALGHRERAVVRWQASWKIAVMALAAIVLCLAAGYRWALPWVAGALAPRVPPALVTRLSNEVLHALDQQMLAPSRLPASRQRELSQGFRRLVARDPELAQSQLIFRHGGKLGPNAFALPDGRIVLLDELAALAAGDGEILAVLAHELGHARYRHGLRQLIQSSVVAAVAAGYFGDVSSLLSGLGALLLESSYTRAFELEADDYGAGLLRANGGAPQDLAAMLEKLEQNRAAKSGRSAVAAGVGDWLSSHPETAERIRRLRATP